MKREIGEIYKRNEEVVIKTESGTKIYYRWMVEQFLGFDIPPGYTVHHINYDHNDNRIDNFCIIPTPLHTWIHRTKGTKNILASNIRKIRENPDLIKARA